MKRIKGGSINSRTSIEALKNIMVQYSADNGLPIKRDRSVRGLTLINQLLNCARMTGVTFNIHNSNVEYNRKIPRKMIDRELPVFKIKYKEKHRIHNDVFPIPNDIGGIYIDHRKVMYTEGTMKITVFVKDSGDDPIYGTKVTIEATCQMPYVGLFYSDMMKKILYIYICSYVMKSRNYMGLEGLQLHTPFTDMKYDSANNVKIA